MYCICKFVLCIYKLRSYVSVVLVCRRSVVMDKLSRVCHLMLMVRSVLLVMGKVYVVCVFWAGLSFIPSVLVG